MVYPHLTEANDLTGQVRLETPAIFVVFRSTCSIDLRRAGRNWTCLTDVCCCDSRAQCSSAAVRRTSPLKRFQLDLVRRDVGQLALFAAHSELEKRRKKEPLFGDFVVWWEI